MATTITHRISFSSTLSTVASQFTGEVFSKRDWTFDYVEIRLHCMRKEGGQFNSDLDNIVVDLYILDVNYTGRDSIYLCHKKGFTLSEGLKASQGSISYAELYITQPERVKHRPTLCLGECTRLCPPSPLFVCVFFYFCF